MQGVDSRLGLHTWRVLSIPLVLFAALALAPAQDSTQGVYLPVGRKTGSPAASVVRKNVDIVLVPVTVLDKSEKTVNGLRAQDFTVLDEKTQQKIKYFSSEDAPLSLTVILDASGSMAPQISAVREAVLKLFKSSNPEDEFRVITVSSKPTSVADMGASLEEVSERLGEVHPNGFTCLWDAMYLGVSDFKEARFQKKAMVVISDGGDNHSRYTQNEIKSILEESDTLVYAVGLFDPRASRLEERMGPLRLDEVTSVTGGRVFPVHSPQDLNTAIQKINRELRNQYVIGYSPSQNPELKGKWHKLKVHLNGEPMKSRLHVYARKGYYAGSD
jgi:Ca-activated chloride channel family protein